MLGLFYPYGVILQALAIVHFMRRRPDGYWLWIILLGGGIGAFAYLIAEVLPDAALLRGTFNAFPRRKRIRQLEAEVMENPSIGNFEELGDLLLEDGQYARARQCFDRAITPRTVTADPFYRRALAAVALNDWQAAVDDLDRVAGIDARYDYHRAAGLRAHALAQVGREDGGAGAVRGGDRHFDVVRDAVQLRQPPRGQRPDRRSARMGAAHPGQEAHLAGLCAPARAGVVPEGVGARAETPQGLSGRTFVRKSAGGCMLVAALSSDGVSMNRRSHWQRVYTSKASTDVSWFQPGPTVSTELLNTAGLQPHT